MRKRIRAIRKSQHLSQREFATKLGVSRSAVTNWEYGMNLPSKAMQDKICQIFHVSHAYLAGASEQMTRPCTDAELVLQAMANCDPVIRKLLLSIVSNPNGWQALAETVCKTADILRDAGLKDSDTDSTC